MSKKKLYEIKTMPNGLKMLAILPISETGICEAYCTIKDNPIGNSKGLTGPYSCNIYKQYGLENGIKDFKLACEAIGIDPSSVISNRLTAFTNKVRIVDEHSLVGYDIFDETNAPRADGLVSSSSKITMFHYAADCSIIFFVDPVKKVAGVLHASWKGSLIGIIENEIKAFEEYFDSNVSDIIAVIMPSISKENFEVGIDCAQQFIDAGHSEFVNLTSYDKPHIDLSSVNRSILLKCGIKSNNLYTIDNLCTMRDTELFHSYRRGPIEDGKHLNGMNGYFIKLK